MTPVVKVSFGTLKDRASAARNKIAPFGGVVKTFAPWPSDTVPAALVGSPVDTPEEADAIVVLEDESEAKHDFYADAYPDKEFCALFDISDPRDQVGDMLFPWDYKYYL